jgi:hypothetical protein
MNDLEYAGSRRAFKRLFPFGAVQAASGTVPGSAILERASA